MFAPYARENNLPRQLLKKCEIQQKLSLASTQSRTQAPRSTSWSDNRAGSARSASSPCDGTTGWEQPAGFIIFSEYIATPHLFVSETNDWPLSDHHLDAFKAVTRAP
jgi:hypothetical protein